MFSEYRHTDYRVKLNSLESLVLMQETRQIQLNTAIQMELWQEAYKSAEDLHNIMQLSKDKDRRMVKPANYVNYYDKVSALRTIKDWMSIYSTLLTPSFLVGPHFLEGRKHFVPCRRSSPKIHHLQRHETFIH